MTFFSGILDLPSIPNSHDALFAVLVAVQPKKEVASLNSTAETEDLEVSSALDSLDGSFLWLHDNMTTLYICLQK